MTVRRLDPPGVTTRMRDMRHAIPMHPSFGLRLSRLASAPRARDLAQCRSHFRARHWRVWKYALFSFTLL